MVFDVKDEDYIEEVLANWEEVHKKGQLSLWVLLALRDEPRYPREINAFLAEVAPQMACEGQSLYRALRRFHDLELVDFTTRKGPRGPDRKYYQLTDLGARVLSAFIERNIRPFYAPGVRLLLMEGLE